MPQRVMSGLTKQEAQKYALMFYLYTTDNPANDEFNCVDAKNFVNPNPGTIVVPMWDRTEGNVQQRIPGQNIMIDAIYVMIFPSPGLGNSRTFTLRDDGADTTFTVTLPDAMIAGGMTGSQTILGGSALSIRHTLTGVPNACTYVTIIVTWHFL